MSRVFGRHWLMSGVAQTMRDEASRWRYSGTMTPENARVILRCTGDHYPTGTRLIFTRDEGMHSSGWWKNPDYERCFHLSISFREPISGEILPKNIELTEKWIEAFYGEDRRYIWAEPPYSDCGKTSETWHYRVFCDPSWTPIIPRGEVYARTLTKRGWKSFSDLQSEHAKTLAKLTPMPGEI